MYVKNNENGSAKYRLETSHPNELEIMNNTHNSFSIDNLNFVASFSTSHATKNEKKFRV